MARCEAKQGFASGVTVRTWTESPDKSPDCQVRGQTDAKHMIEVKSICLFDLTIHCESSTDPTSTRTEFTCASDSPPDFEVTPKSWKRRNVSLRSGQLRRANDVNDVIVASSTGPSGPEPIEVRVVSEGGALSPEQKTLSITVEA